MKRKITLLVCAVTVITMIFGACGTNQPGASPAPSSDTVIVGEIDGKPVYLSKLELWLNMNGYGTDVLTDPTYADVLPDVLDTFMTVEAMNAEVIKRGYLDKLTSEQITQAEQNAQTDLDYSVQNYGVTEEQVLGIMGITKAELIDQYKLKVAANAAYTELVGDVKPTEEQIKQSYDETVASQKEQMDADPTAYVTNVNAAADVYYAPAGVRMVRKLLIPIDTKSSEAIAMLRDQGYDDQANTLLTKALADIQAKADEVTGKLNSGMSFNDAMTQYNKDTNTVEGGYPVVTGATDYPETFTAKAMAIAGIGKLSEMFSTDEGYQILEYTSDVTPGAMQYESVKSKVSDNLLADVQADAWSALVEQWKTEHNVKKFIENIKATQPSPSPTDNTAPADSTAPEDSAAPTE